MKPKEAVCMVVSSTVECEITREEFVQDLLVLLIEGRIPDVSEQGRKEGLHCWPLTRQLEKNCCAQTRKPDEYSLCDLVSTIKEKTPKVLSDNECLMVEVFASLESKEYSSFSLQNNQQRIHLDHLQESSKYILIEKWKIELLKHNQISGKNRLISIQLFLQAVRSFLHFSQLSAWLISSQGLNPAHVSYKISLANEPASMPFIQQEELHVFPLTDISKTTVAKLTSFSLPRMAYDNMLLEKARIALERTTIMLPNSQAICRKKCTSKSDASCQAKQNECDTAEKNMCQNESLSYKRCFDSKIENIHSNRTGIVDHFSCENPSEAFTNLGQRTDRDCNRGTVSNGNLDSLLTKSVKESMNSTLMESQMTSTKRCRSRKLSECERECSCPTLSDSRKLQKKRLSNSYCTEKLTNIFVDDRNCNSSSEKRLSTFDNYCSQNGHHEGDSSNSDKYGGSNCSASMPVSNSGSAAITPSESAATVSKRINTSKENLYPSHMAYFQGEIDEEDNDKGITFVARNSGNKKTSRTKTHHRSSDSDKSENISPLNSAMAASKTRCHGSNLDTSESMPNITRAITSTMTSTPEYNEDETAKNQTCPFSSTKCHARSKSMSAQILTEKTTAAVKRLRSKNPHARLSLGACTVPIFHRQTNLPINSSPAPLRRPESQVWNIGKDGSMETESELSDNSSPHLLSKSTPASSTSLLGNFEESMLKGRMPAVGRVEGFSVVLGASGSFCPRQTYLPVKAHFFNLSDDDAPSPYLGYVRLKDSLVGKKGYHIPRHGTVQVTLFNPNKTVVKVFVVLYNYDDMPYNSQTFLRQRTVSVRADADDEEGDLQQSLHYTIHLRFRCSKHGRLYLHTDIRVIFPQQTPDIPPGFRLRTLTDGPTDPKYTPLSS